MSQEYGSNYSNIYCNTIPYWDNRCGDFFYEINEFEPKYDTFINNLDIYKPREYILENLNIDKCANRFTELF